MNASTPKSPKLGQPAADAQHLDARSRTLLKTLIERYIEEGEPVGSRSLSKFSGLEVSAATIRNVMSDLEELGLVASPHTSAGRVPTPRGYRLFVDSMLTVQPFEVNPQTINPQLVVGQQIEQPQRLIESAANMLSSLSSFAGIVTTPKRSAMFSHLEFMRLGEKRVLLIIVTPQGDVQNRILLTERDFAPMELIEAGNFINAHFAGLTIEDIQLGLATELADLRTDMSALMEAAVRMGSQAMTEQNETVVISGERNLLGVNDLSSNMDRLKQLFGVFEQKTALLQLMHATTQAQGVQIFIGGDSELVPMDDMTVVTAPYQVNGVVVGTLGVIGPTRMAYDRIIPIVDITARLLTNALNSGLPQR